MAHHQKEASDYDGENDGSSAVTLTSLCASKYKVATTTLKISILFNQSADIKVGFFGKFEFVESQRVHRETFCDDPVFFPGNPNNKNKPISENEIYTLSQLCMFDVFIHIIRKFYVGTGSVDDSRSTQEVCQAITILKQEWKGVNGNSVTLTP